MTKTVTLCGSTRFEDEFIEASRQLSFYGILVYTLAVYPSHRQINETWKDGTLEKTMGDLLYFERILKSDAVVVLGDGYIGESCAREILWAGIQKKPIYQHLLGTSWYITTNRINDPWHKDDSYFLIPAARHVFEKSAVRAGVVTPKEVDKVRAAFEHNARLMPRQPRIQEHESNPRGFDPAQDIPS